MDRAQIIHENLLRRIKENTLPDGAPPEAPLDHATAMQIFRAAIDSRNLDRVSRVMQTKGQGFYTIGSSGHESMAAVAAALRPDDMAFLHYRDGAFLLARAAQKEEIVPRDQILRDMLMSFACAADDPVSGGRHKVLGAYALSIPPQTSTIASHLPKALGAAWSIGAAKRARPRHRVLPEDAIVFCSFGDASANHSTAQGAFNAASWTAVQGAPLPLLFCCEDNGIGISTKTPPGWIENTFKHRLGLKYFSCNGLDIFDTFRVAQAAQDYVRKKRKPAFLHMKTVRLYGHAGADIQSSYLSKAEIEADEANDPLLHMIRGLREAGMMTPDAALAAYHDSHQRIESFVPKIVALPPLRNAAEVMASIVPPARDTQQGANGPSPEQRAALFASDAKAMTEPQPMARLINWALHDLMLAHEETLLMGEDIGRKGGVYGVTQKLQQRFGATRVIDTLLDEQSILGLAIGVAHNGFIPIPEIQFLAYLHNAEDQLRGEAATLPFFSRGAFTNPMVVRIAGLGYQKGFGGHFHNDNSLAVLRDIPGLILAIPSDGAEAVKMLRECHRLAREENRVVVFVEPIALYQSRDLNTLGDGQWARVYPALDAQLRFGEVAYHGPRNADVTIVSFGNGVYLSQQARTDLAAQGITTRLIDLRWIAPLPLEALAQHITPTDKVLIVDETRRSGGVAEGLMAHFVEMGVMRQARLSAEDSFIATGPAYATTLPSKDAIIRAVRSLCAKN